MITVAFRSCLSPRIGRSRLQSPVIALDAVVGVLVGSMPCRRKQLLQHRQVDRRSVGDHLDCGNPVCAYRPLEEPVGSLGVSAWGDAHVDDLAGLVDGAVDVARPSGDSDVGLVDQPPGTDRVPARACGVSQQRGEPLHPTVDADVVDLDASLGE
jgi:hypothetical protein